MRLLVSAAILACSSILLLAPGIHALGNSTTGDRTSHVFVHIPFQLRDPQGFAHVQAEFGGTVQHTVSSTGGRSLAEYVYYTNQTLCEPLQFTKTTEKTPPKLFPSVTQYPQHHPFLLLADFKDGCSAVTQARHAQQAGAAALILADEYCLCSNKECVDKYKKANDTTFKCLDDPPTLVNDGSAGPDLSIPTFLIYKVLSEELKDALMKKKQPVLMELQWGVPDTTNLEDHKPQFHLWTTAYDPLVSLEFYTNLRTVTKAFYGHAHFSPRFALVDGQRFSCNKEPDTNGPCDHLCTNHGRYCTLHAKDLSGYAIVRETTRRLCIWKHYAEAGHQDQWWDYILYHKQQCAAVGPHKFSDAGCVSAALHAAHIDNKVIDACLKDAGDLDQDVTNALLDEQLKRQNHSSVVSLPAISVNHAVLEYTTAHALFETLCTEYWLSASPTIPHVCETCGACPNVIGCLEKGHCVNYSEKQRHPDTGFENNDSNNKKKGGGRGWKVFWTLSFAAMLCAGGWYYYKKHYDRNGGDFASRGALMNSYMQLSGEG